MRNIIANSKKEIEAQIKKKTEELQRLIEIVNYIPPGFPLLSLNLEQELAEKRISEIKGIDNPITVFNDSPEYLSAYLKESGTKPDEVVSLPQILEACLLGTPMEFQEYLDEQTGGLYAIYDDPIIRQLNKVRLLANEYVKFYEFHLLMHRITDAFEEDREREKRSVRHLSDDLVKLRVYELILQKDEDGIARPVGIFGLLGWFDQTRLRKCKICTRIFWAKRKDKETCSPKCLHALVLRKYRETHSEEINQKRRDNYKYKKGKESKKNGTL